METEIATVVGYLASQLKENVSIKSFLNDFAEGTVNWMRDIFLKKDGSENDMVRSLKEKPDSPAKQNVVKAAIASALEDNPSNEHFLLAMAKVIAEKTRNKATNNTMNVTGDNNNSIQGISGSTITINK